MVPSRLRRSLAVLFVTLLLLPAGLRAEGATARSHAPGVISAELVKQIVERGQGLGIALTPEDVRRAAPAFPPGSTLDQQVALTQKAVVLAPLAAFMIRGCIQGLAGLGASHALYTATDGGLGEPWSLRAAGRDCLTGMATGGLFGAAKVGVLSHLTGARLAPLAHRLARDSFRLRSLAGIGPAAAVATELMTAVQKRAATEVPGCDFFGSALGVATFLLQTTLIEWVNDCAMPALLSLEGQSFEELTVTAPSLGETSDPVVPLLLRADNGFDFSPLLAASDDVEIAYAVVPTRTGSLTVRLGVIHGGGETILRTDTIAVTSSAQLFVPIDGELLLAAQSLLDLDPGPDGEFRFFLAIVSGAFSTRYEGPEPAGVRVMVDPAANLAPSGTIEHDAVGRLVRFSGSYRDLDADPALDLTLRLTGTSGVTHYNLLPYLAGSGWSQAREFSRSLFLANGVYSYSLLLTNGHHSRAVGPFALRVSESAPQLSLILSASAATVGQPVAGTVSVSDALGPVPGAEVSLATDRRSEFRTAAGERTRKVATGTDGVAHFTYVPLIGGEHSLLAMEPTEHEFALGGLAVEGEVSDWTTEWNWSLLSSSPTEATYEVQVLVRYQGTDLDPGDYVVFSANHGAFDDEEDQVGASSIAVNRYTLTRAEADSGDEIITISLPHYDAEITHFTNLAVGPSATMTPVRTLALTGQGDDSDSVSVAFSRDGRFAARLAAEQAVEIYNLGDLSPVRTVLPGGDDLTCLAFSPDGEKIVTGDIDGNLAVLSVATGAVLRRSATNGHADILDLDWYDTDRIAAATQGGSSTHPFTPAILILNAALSPQRTIAFPGLGSGEDVLRVRCNGASDLCAAATAYGDSRWFLFTEAGSVVASRLHPDADVFWAIAFNTDGDRLFVGGEDSNGAAMAHLYDVSSAGVVEVGQILSLNRDYFAATFFVAAGEERLAVGGDTLLELFSPDGGGALAASSDQGVGDKHGYSLTFLADREQLVAVRELGQTFLSLGTDSVGPTISVATPPALSYTETSISLEGSIDDPSGVGSASIRREGGGWQALALGASGHFSFVLTDLAVGETRIDLRATDLPGNSTEVSVTVLRRDDTSPPLVSQVQVSPSSGVAGMPFTLSAQVIDADAGVASVTAVVRGPGGQAVTTLSMAAGEGSSYAGTFASQSAGPGIHSVDIEAIDLSAHANRRQVSGAASFQVEPPLPATHAITVSVLGAGSGTIASNPAGIACGTDCSESYPAGTVVTLTASPAPGSVFTGWSGACAGGGACALTLDANRTASATFSVATVPAAPSWLRVTADSSSQISLRWDDNATNESGFTIERKLGDAGPWTVVGSPGPNTLTFLSSGLAACSSYAYRVRAFNIGGTSAWSNEARTSTLGCGPPPAAPAAPSWLRVTAESSSQISLRWDDNASNESGFAIERKLSNAGPWTIVGSPGPIASTFLSSRQSEIGIKRHTGRSDNGTTVEREPRRRKY